MPYIRSERRPRFDDLIERLVTNVHTCGEFNYVITRIMKKWTDRSHDVIKGASYETFSRVLADLEAAKMEWYRRIMVPYEEQKRQEHGDVYDK